MSFLAISSLIFLSLLPIVNPIGMSSVFLSMTDNLKPEARHKLAFKVAVYSAGLLIAILFFGPIALSFFGLTLPFIRIAGGLLVSFTAWQMLNAKPKLSEMEEEEHAENEDLVFFPLTLPITAGAGAIAITVAIALDIDKGFNFHVILQYAGAVLGIALMMALVYVCYRFADTILSKIGRTGTAVVTRLSAFVLLAIGLSVIWTGLLKLIIIAKAAN